MSSSHEGKEDSRAIPDGSDDDKQLSLMLDLNVPGRILLILPLEIYAGGSRGQKIETILVNMVKPHLY